ncbi:MAG TPA: hypothetical protein VF185_03770 [Patescibacteria group bacterium]
MTNELRVGLGQDFATHSYLNRVFGPLEEAVECEKISLQEISSHLQPLALSVGVNVPAQNYDATNSNWSVTNSGLRRLVDLGHTFDLAVTQNSTLAKEEKTKEIMMVFIAGANHLAYTNDKIAALLDHEDSKTQKESLAQEGTEAVETAIAWAKKYGLGIEMTKNLNDYVVTERTRCLSLPPQEALKKLARLTMTMSMIIETCKKLGLPPNSNYFNNHGVLYTDMADRFYANPNINIKGTNFEACIHSSLKAFSEADKQVEAIVDKESPDYQRKKIMVASNTAQVHLLTAEYYMAERNPYSYTLPEQVKGFNRHFAVASGIMNDIDMKENKSEYDKRILEFFNAEIYSRGIRALIVIAQYIKQGFTITAEYVYEKKQLINLISKFDGRPVKLDMTLSEVCKYGKNLMTRYNPDDEDDIIAKAKVAELLKEVTTGVH